MSRLALLLALAIAACAPVYDYDPTQVGSGDGSDRVARSKSSSQFIRGIYADLVGRAPALYSVVLQGNGVTLATVPIDEQAQLVAALDGIGDPVPMRNLVVNGLLHRAEVTIPDKANVADARDFIGQQFTRLLGREPSPYELQAFADGWATDPAVGPRTVIRAITGSREYQSQ